MKLWSLNAAAELLERDRRTLVKVLKTVKPDGNQGRQPRWKLSSIFNACFAHELRGVGATPAKIVDEHARLTRARAEKIERENALAAGRLVDVEIVGRMLEEENKIVTEHFLNLAGAQGHALALAARTAPNDEVGMILVSEKLREAIHAALSEAAAPAQIVEMAQGNEARRRGRREEENAAA